MTNAELNFYEKVPVILAKIGKELEMLEDIIVQLKEIKEEISFID